MNYLIKPRKGLCVAAALLGVLSFSSCSTWDKLDRTERGAIIGTGSGAAIGGAAGGTTGAVVGGAVGGVGGGLIGRELDRNEEND